MKLTVILEPSDEGGFTAYVPARVKEVEARKNPTRRLATAEDTAELVNFLASKEAGYINGANLPLTGGPV